MKQIEPIAIFHSPLREKFGVPRQSGIAATLPGRIVLEPQYAQPEALRGMEGFDYLWLIWGFHRAVRSVEAQGFKATVRPPRLGGNERMGVFATRSPFRPNGLGLSSVRIAAIGQGSIEVLGADLMDQTPIYDIKPYLPSADSHPEARGGFTEKPWQPLDVHIPEEIVRELGEARAAALTDVLRQDPRPHYQADAERVYGMAYHHWNVRFRVSGHQLTVVALDC